MALSHFWLVSNQGLPQKIPIASVQSSRSQVYRIYRFLTEIEDVLVNESDDFVRLPLMVPKVFQLLTESDWLRYEYHLPDPQQGWSVNTLYDEPDFPLTVQMVTWASQEKSTTHNHGTWGIVAVIDGQEKHTFWQKVGPSEHSNQLEMTQELVLEQGEVIAFLPNAIHCVRAISEQPTVTFNLYGETDYQSRYVFNHEEHTAQLF